MVCSLSFFDLVPWGLPIWLLFDDSCLLTTRSTRCLGMWWFLICSNRLLADSVGRLSHECVLFSVLRLTRCVLSKSTWLVVLSGCLCVFLSCVFVTSVFHRCFLYLVIVLSICDVVLWLTSWTRGCDLLPVLILWSHHWWDYLCPASPTNLCWCAATVQYPRRRCA